MVIQVGINGFGRIGRVIFRTCCQHPDLQIAAINDPAIELKYICYLIKFDSTHGKYKGNISYEGDEIKINGLSIKVFHQKAPSDIPWQNAGVQYVIETSGMFTSLEKASGHLASDGVRRVLVTAPSSDVPMLVLGVNQERIDPDVKVISCTSSTLYCLAPIIKVLEDEFGVEEGFMTSIHAMTPSLKPLDGLCVRGKHWRDHRSIHQNIIPAATGACRALGRIIPGVRDKLAGLAFRVPIVNVSVLDLSVRLNKNTTMKEITQCIEKFKDSTMKGIIQVSKDQAVSSDFIGDKHSCTLDADSSLQLKPNFFKLICWYENEYSYACRVVDTILYSEKRHLLFFTPLTKMTYVRPIFWKAHSEQTDISQKHVAVECVSISKLSLNPGACEARPVPRPVQRPLSPYVSEASQILKQRVLTEESEAFKACIDKLGRCSSLQNKIDFHENSIAFKHTYQKERVKAQERLESVKKAFSRMVNVTEDLLKKSSSKRLAPALVIRSTSKEKTEKENTNAHSSELLIRSLTKATAAKENTNNHLSEMATGYTSKGGTEEENIITHAFGLGINNSFKGIAEKEESKTHLSGISIKNPSKCITEKDNSNAHSSVLTIRSFAEATVTQEHSNTPSSEMAIRNPSKGITEAGNSNIHLSATPISRYSTEIIEKQYSNARLPGLASKTSSKKIIENEHSYITAIVNRSPSKEATEIKETISVKKDLNKRPITDSFENNIEESNSYLPNEICGEVKSFNISDISNSAGEYDSLNKSMSTHSNNQLPKPDSPICNKTENAVGLNVFQNIQERRENNNISFKSKNTVKTINKISWDRLQQQNHNNNKLQVANGANKLTAENLSRNVKSSIIDDNCNIDEEHKAKGVIHIVSVNPEYVVTSSKTNEQGHSKVIESEKLSNGATLNESKAEPRQDVNLITADLLNRALSKIEIVDEKLKQRNIVLVEYGVENAKFENNINENNNTVVASDFRKDSFQEIPREHQSVSHDSINIMSELTSLCTSPANTVTTISYVDTYRSKQDIYDKLDSASVSGSENSFQMLEKKSQIINITDLTYSLDDLARLDKICRIIEISDELSDKLFAPLDDRSGGATSQRKWSFKDLCKRIKLDEFCDNVFGKTAK